MAWSRTEAELAFARTGITTASRAAGIEAPFDTVWVDLADEEGLEISARTAFGFGFQGKMCIHPKQIGIVNRVFTPGEAEVAYAERVVAAFAEAEAAGSAAIPARRQIHRLPDPLPGATGFGKDGGHPREGRTTMTRGAAQPGRACR
jgi:citrate lyase beta subunit